MCGQSGLPTANLPKEKALALPPVKLPPGHRVDQQPTAGGQSRCQRRQLTSHPQGTVVS